MQQVGNGRPSGQRRW